MSELGEIAKKWDEQMHFGLFANSVIEFTVCKLWNVVRERETQQTKKGSDGPIDLSMDLKYRV